MADYQILKEAVSAVIKNNGNQEITGDLLQSTLFSIINTLGTGYQFAGVASSAVVPGTPDAKLFYVAEGPGIYDHFNNLVVNDGELAFFIIPGGGASWYKMAVPIGIVGYALFSDTVYDYSSLPAKPTDKRCYFLFADRVVSYIKYRYLFTSNPNVDGGAWKSITTMYRIRMAVNEQSTVGNTPAVPSVQYLENYIAQRQEIKLVYSGLGSAREWDDFVDAVEPLDQMSADLQVVEAIAANGSAHPVSISVDGGINFSYLISRSYEQGLWTLVFGVGGSEVTFAYDENEEMKYQLY